MKTALLACSALLAFAYGVLSPGWYDAGVSTALLAVLKSSGIVLLALIALWAAGASPAGAGGARLERAASGGAYDTQRSAAGGRALQPSDAGAQTPARAVHNRLLAAGLLFGALGDALLAWSPDTFLYGALAFLIGHLLYIALFMRAGLGVAALRQPARLAAMAALVVAAIVSTSLLVPRDSAMFAPLSVYTGVLTLMAMSSFTLPWRRWLAMAGAVLFFISDGFVAANLFHAPADATAAFWMNFSGWMIYWAGQAAICWGALGLHKADPK